MSEYCPVCDSHHEPIEYICPKSAKILQIQVLSELLTELQTEQRQTQAAAEKYGGEYFISRAHGIGFAVARIMDRIRMLKNGQTDN